MNQGWISRHQSIPQSNMENTHNLHVPLVNKPYMVDAAHG